MIKLNLLNQKETPPNCGINIIILQHSVDSHSKPSGSQGKGPGNLKFHYKISKVWQKIVPIGHSKHLTITSINLTHQIYNSVKLQHENILFCHKLIQLYNTFTSLQWQKKSQFKIKIILIYKVKHLSCVVMKNQ
jgi:hypothetical protein